MQIARTVALRPTITLFTYLAVNWWASWYPGAEPGGGGYVAQRIFSAKDEKHGLLATFWFNIAHYALRPWPWILTALASLILYPELADKETGYITKSIACAPVKTVISRSTPASKLAATGKSAFLISSMPAETRVSIG